MTAGVSVSARGVVGRTRADIAGRLVGAVPAIAVFGLVLVSWEVVLGALGVQQFLIPRPTTIAAAFADQWPILQRAVVYTGFEALAGLAVGCSLGLLAATATARWGSAREALLPVAVAANSIPIIA